MLFSATLLALTLGVVHTMPAHLAAYHQSKKVEDLVYGDIKLTEKQKLIRQLPENARAKLFVSDDSQRWPNNIVPVTFSDRLTPENQQKIRQALKSIEDRTCFRFPDKRPEHKDYIKFEFNTVPNSPCWSSLGRIGGEQQLSLVQGCIDDPEGTVGHEVLHALGVNHEHQRPDRDLYIDMDSEWATRFGYEKLPTKMDLQRFPYDIHSIMHYEGFEIWENGRKVRMLYLKGTNTPVARNKKLSDEDVRKLNDLGNCPANTGSKQNFNQNGNQRGNRRFPKKPSKNRRRSNRSG